MEPPACRRQAQIYRDAKPHLIRQANSYISARSETIEAIEKTITELGGIFSQLAQMVGEQSEMIPKTERNNLILTRVLIYKREASHIQKSV